MRARSHQPPGRGPLVAHAARGSTTSKTLMLDRCPQYGPRLLEVTEERNGPSGLRDDDDDDESQLTPPFSQQFPALFSGRVLINSFAAAGDYSRQRALSAGVDRSRHILHTSEIYDIFHSNGLRETTHCGVLSKNYSAAKELTPFPSQ